MRIEAHRGEGEFRHMRLADDDRAGSTQTPDDCRIRRCGRRCAADDRACERRFAGYVEEVLDGDDPPVEESEAPFLAPPPVGGVRFRAGRLRIEFHEGALFVPAKVEAGKNGFEAVAGGHVGPGQAENLVNCGDCRRSAIAEPASGARPSSSKAAR